MLSYGCNAPSAKPAARSDSGVPRARSASVSSATSTNLTAERPRQSLAGLALPVRQTPEYRQASLLYQKGDFAGALSLLDHLTASGSVTEQSFLDRQRSLCREAMARGKGGPLSGTGTVTPDASPRRGLSPFRARTGSLATTDCGPRALLLVCQQMGVKADLDSLRRAAGTGKDGTSLEGLAKAAASVGLKAEGVQMDKQALARLTSPAVAWMNGNHYIAVLGVRQRLLDGAALATIHDPNHDREEEVSQTDLLSKSGGVLLVLHASRR